MKNDALLVARAALLGDRQAFGSLAEAWQSPLRRFFFHLTGGNGELAKDLTQDTLLKAWINIGSFRAAAKFSTWLYRIAYNTFYDYNRSCQPGYEQAVETAGARLEAPQRDHDAHIDLPTALARLEERQRTAMLLYYMEDMAVERIAGIMDVPAGTVKSLLSRGRETLAAHLKNSGYER